MPKLKTHKGSKKRFRVTRNGKVVARKAGKRHLMSHKSSKRKRQLRRTRTLPPAEAKRYAKVLGKYGK